MIINKHTFRILSWHPFYIFYIIKHSIMYAPAAAAQSWWPQGEQCGCGNLMAYFLKWWFQKYLAYVFISATFNEKRLYYFCLITIVTLEGRNPSCASKNLITVFCIAVFIVTSNCLELHYEYFYRNLHEVLKKSLWGHNIYCVPLAYTSLWIAQ